MPSRNPQLAELLSTSSHCVAQLTEALTAFSLELMASDDPAVRIASRRMVARIAAIRSAFDRQLEAEAACQAIGAAGPVDHPPG
ncbi:hypothetical protein [Stutzerimonas zhaodongensis]|uniref:hypothetical protein n=1 Tax=Stutzerimonas zhaodongensis TaxID=1176257 RepID=UPI0011C4A8FF|nr:hypothetical protein [Stutzerimonas zhaodongensis]MCQ2030429.1 hypothetical protein [Stutzerimonas zhaodongensis]MCQ4317613.1 hypothetical protein [Stutzerimonas zhaodongensis]